jgi:hypothetical protein
VRRRGTGLARKVRCGMVLLVMLGLCAAAWAQRAETVPEAGSVGGVAADGLRGQDAAKDQGTDQGQGKADDDGQSGFVIEPTEAPPTYLQGPYHVRLYGRGNYVPMLRWKLEKGKLPPGIKLTDDGWLQGAAQQAGEFQFVISAKDGNQPPQAVQKGFSIKVTDAMTVAWKTPPHVSGNRIDGSVEVANLTADDIDLTFDVKAIASDGRATEIGYQNFPLKKGTAGMVLPFGDTLPHGAYLVNVSVEGAIPKRSAFYREQLQTPGPLHVLTEP